MKLASIFTFIAALIFGYISFTMDWNTSGDMLIGIVCLGMAAIMLFLSIEFWNSK